MTFAEGIVHCGGIYDPNSENGKFPLVKSQVELFLLFFLCYIFQAAGILDIFCTIVCSMIVR